MKMNLDDPKLTAYALGELPTEERAALAEAIAQSEEAQEFVRETQQLQRMLRSEFAAELREPEHKAVNIMPLPQEWSFWSDARWMSIGLAALLAVAAVVAAVALSGVRAPGGVAVRERSADTVVEMEFPAEGAPEPAPAGTPPQVAYAPPPAPVDSLRSSLAKEGDTSQFVVKEPAMTEAQPPVDLARSRPASAPMVTKSSRIVPSEPPQQFNTAEYAHFDENPFLAAATNPLSTFSVDVDTASYANVRRFLTAGERPPKDAVRIEELINYFSYDYPQPTGDEPFSVNLEAASCPWKPEHRLVRIGLKGRDIASEQRAPSNLVFLLDVSGSMTPAERLPLIKQSMRLLVERLRENDRVAIVVYAGASGLALPSTSGAQKEKILSALEELKAGGSTNGAAGIELAYQVAADNFIKDGVNRVILATDGDFNVGVTSQGDLVRLAEEKAKGGVFLTVLGVGTDNFKDSTMEKLADKANGNYAYLDSLAEARKVLVQQMNGTLVTIAKDVKIQVEFNPAVVASYRLLGYENRMLRKEDFNNDKVDAGEIGAGHTVTALYEVVPAGKQSDPAVSVPPVDPLKYQREPGKDVNAAGSNELLTVKLRHKRPDGDESKLTEKSLTDSGTAFANASPDLKFAAAVAQFGMLLRGSPHRGNGTMGAVIEWAQEGRGRDVAGYRAGFIELAQRAQVLAF